MEKIIGADLKCVIKSSSRLLTLLSICFCMYIMHDSPANARSKMDPWVDYIETSRNPIVEKISQTEVEDGKTPSAVAYNFVNAVLEMDYNKMAELSTPQYANYLNCLLENKYEGNKNALLIDFFSEGKLGILSWKPALKNGYEVAVTYIQDESRYWELNMVEVWEPDSVIDVAEITQFAIHDISEFTPLPYVTEDNLGGEYKTVCEGVIIKNVDETGSEPDFVDDNSDTDTEETESCEIEWEYICWQEDPEFEDGSWYWSPDAIIKNGKIYLDGEKKPKITQICKKVYVKCIPSYEIGTTGFQDVSPCDNSNVKVLVNWNDGKWRVNGFK